MSVLLSLEGLVFLMSCIPTASYNLSTSISAELSEPLEEKLVGGLPFRTECSEVFFLFSLPSCGSFICSHILQEEVSLKTTEQGAHLWE